MSTLLIAVILFITIIAGGLLVFISTISGKTLKLILSFSGAFLFAISVLHLLPDIYVRGGGMVGVYILIGFFIQILMEYFSEGIEHGHIHLHDHDHNEKNNFPVVMMLALSIHSFLEGMPLGQQYEGNGELVRSLFVGITLHNIPISIALMSMLLQSHLKRTKAFFWLCIFALMTPAGMLVSQLIGQGMASDVLSHYYNNIMALVVGIFLHISTTILFESSENHRFNLVKFAAIIGGALLAFISA